MVCGHSVVSVEVLGVSVGIGDGALFLKEMGCVWSMVKWVTPLGGRTRVNRTIVQRWQVYECRLVILRTNTCVSLFKGDGI